MKPMPPRNETVRDGSWPILVIIIGMYLAGVLVGVGL